MTQQTGRQVFQVSTVNARGVSLKGGAQRRIAITEAGRTALAENK